LALAQCRLNGDQGGELYRIVSAKSVRLGKLHSLINQSWTDLNHLVLSAQVELKSVYQDVKAGLINIAFRWRRARADTTNTLLFGHVAGE
jgi:hypothetical protein